VLRDYLWRNHVWTHAAAPRTGHSGDLDVFLKRLVEDTRLLFSATGAAVALLDGQVCAGGRNAVRPGLELEARSVRIRGSPENVWLAVGCNCARTR